MDGAGSISSSLKKREPRTMIVSRIASLLSSKSEIQLPLRSRTLQSKPKRQNQAIFTAVSILALSLFAGFAYLGGLAAANVKLNDNIPYLLVECSRATTTGLASYFQIDIRAPLSLTFDEARILSIAWDFVVGQLGRVLHGWILYKFVLSPGVNRIMESTPVPYLVYVDLKLRPTSVHTLWTIIRSLWQMASPASTISMIWYFVAILYVVGFANIWGATTGYVNPTTRLYQMPDTSYVSVDQYNLLSFCWTHDDPRLPNVPKLIKSPTLDILNATAQVLTDSGRKDQITPSVSYISNRTMLEYGMFPRNVSEYSDDFMDIYWCESYMLSSYFKNVLILVDMITQGQLYSYLNDADWVSDGYAAIVNGPLQNSNLTISNITDSQQPWQYEIVDGEDQLRPPALYSQINAWQFLRKFPGSFGPGDFQNTSWGPINYDQLPDNTYYPLTPNTAIRADFVYNQSITAAPGKLPYNSTMLFRGSPTILTAPFAQFGNDCHNIVGMGSPCLCYENTPIPYPLDDNHVICVSDNNYVWGFSSMVTAIALFLEMGWILGCWIGWLDASINSKLNNLQRDGSGPLRTAFDVVQAVRMELGEDNSTYSDDELRTAIRACGYVGFHVDESSTTTKFSLVSRDKRWKGRPLKQLRAEIWKRKRRSARHVDELSFASSVELLPRHGSSLDTSSV